MRGRIYNINLYYMFAYYFPRDQSKSANEKSIEMSKKILFLFHLDVLRYIKLRDTELLIVFWVRQNSHVRSNRLW